VSERWSRLWRDLTGRSDEVFIELLLAQVSISLKAAKVLRDAQQHDDLPDDVHEEIHRLEDEGDERRTTMLTEMGRALITPIDREDLFRLSHSLDDVLDNLRDFTVELDRYGAEPSERFTAPLDAIAKGLQQMEHAIAELREGTDEVTAAARAAKHANDARSAYHDSMAELLHEEEVTMRTLRQRELLRRLDIAGLRLGEAADALTSGALKRG
jgi:predicted phosphate transport protein (TIGR00153 family)